MRLHVIANEPNLAGTFRMDLIIASIARRQLWLTDAYFVATSPYVQALRAAARDGVDVRLLVPGASDIPALSPLSRAQYRPLLEAGVRVFEWAGTMLHAKTAVADRRWSRVGSTNLNLASWMSNYELDVAIEDATFSEQMAWQYEADLARSTEIVLTKRNRVRRAPQAEAADRAARACGAARGVGKRRSRGGGCVQRRQCAGRSADRSPHSRTGRGGPAVPDGRRVARHRRPGGAVAACARVARRARCDVVGDRVGGEGYFVAPGPARRAARSSSSKT